MFLLLDPMPGITDTVSSLTYIGIFLKKILGTV